MQNWQVQVTLVGAGVCALLSVLLQGATRWTLIGSAVLLAIWTLYLFIKKPKDAKQYPSSIPTPSLVSIKIDNSPVITQTQSNPQTQSVTHDASAPQILNPRHEKAELKFKPIVRKFLTLDHHGFHTTDEVTGLIGVLIPIYNHPTASKVDARYIRAHLVFKDSKTGNELSIAGAPWIDGGYRLISLERGETGKIIAVVFNKNTPEKPAALDDRNDDPRVDSENRFEPHQLPYCKQLIEIHLIWGGDGQFNIMHNIELDLENVE